MKTNNYLLKAVPSIYTLHVKPAKISTQSIIFLIFFTVMLFQFAGIAFLVMPIIKRFNRYSKMTVQLDYEHQMRSEIASQNEDVLNSLTSNSGFVLTELEYLFLDDTRGWILLNRDNVVSAYKSGFSIPILSEYQKADNGWMITHWSVILLYQNEPVLLSSYPIPDNSGRTLIVVERDLIGYFNSAISSEIGRAYFLDSYLETDWDSDRDPSLYKETFTVPIKGDTDTVFFIAEIPNFYSSLLKNFWMVLIMAFFLFIFLFSLLSRYLNSRIFHPLENLSLFIQKEVYNLDVDCLVPDSATLPANLQQLLRSVQEIISEFELRNKLLMERNKKLELISLTDGLTEIPNRSALNQHLEKVNNETSLTSPMVLMLMDVDFFKAYNDFYGHLAGDEVLKKVASVFNRILYPRFDFWARYGGEEFAVILSNTDSAVGIRVAERLRAAVEDLNIPHTKSTVAEVLTCSIGLASNLPGFFIKSEEMIEIADKALYYSKTKGRNRVSAFTPVDLVEEDSLEELEIVG